MITLDVIPIPKAATTKILEKSLELAKATLEIVTEYSLTEIRS